MNEKDKIEKKDKMNEKNKTLMRIFLGIYVIIMLIFAKYTFAVKSYLWLVDELVTFVICFFVYVFRERLRLNPVNFLMLLFALGLHNFGVYGAYSNSYFNISFDHYTHFFASLAISMILFSYLLTYKLKLPAICFIVILMTLGVSAIHETVEFCGYTLFGQDGGNLFFPGAIQKIVKPEEFGASNSYQNTMMDILVNFIGSISGCIILGLKKNVLKRFK